MASSDKAPPDWGDASTYTDIAGNLEEVVAARNLGYFALRILPSAIVHYGVHAAGAALDPPTVQRGFEVLNLVLLVVSALAWALLAQRLSFRGTARWLGFALLFVNYGVLRWLFGVPALTDASGFALGMGQTFGLFSGWRWRQLALSVVAFFVWPQAGVAGLLLFLFPKAPLRTAPATRNATVAAVVAAAAFVAWVGVLVLLGRTAMPFGGQQVHAALLPLSVLLAAAWVFAVGRGLLDAEELFHVRRLFARVAPSAWVAAACAVAAVAVVARVLGREATSRYPSLLVSAVSFLDWSVLTSVTLPGLFLVAHVVFLGPGLLLIALLFRPFCRATHALGVGATLYVAASLLFLLNASSRVSFAAWPLLVAVLATVLDARQLGRPQSLAIGATAVALARPFVPVWPLVAAVSFKEAQVPPFIAWMRGWLPLENFYRGPWRFLDFPHQYLHMTNGPWMSVEMYVLQALAVVLLAALLAAAALRRRAA
jgi:hypothetical protein